MKIVHVIASSGLYGAEKWILALMRAMDGSKVSSILVNLADTNNEISAVVSAARERGLEALDFHTGGTFNPLCIIRFSRWLKNCDADIVHGHGYKSDLVGLLGARFAGCKMISTPHGWSKGADKKLRFYESLDRFIFRVMDFVCPLSEELLESVANVVDSKKIRLIMNGVDIDEIDSCVPAFEKKSDEIIIGYIGRLVEGKDIPTLIYAFKLLSNAFKGKGVIVKLLVVGDGEDNKYLKNLVTDLGLIGYVEFLGFRSDAISYLKCFDVFVLPSLSEGISRCLMESLSSGVISVASDIRGNRVIVEHKKTGFLFDVGDSKSLSNILIEIIQDKEKHYPVSIAGRTLVEQKYSSKKMAEEYQDVYFNC
jgi:glycosyltransferase involved in cell wall biosynthesis